MNLIVLSGAYKNAGDYLIEKRTIDLLRHLLPQCDIKRYVRNQLGEITEEIKQADAVVFSGGPIYMQNLVKYLPNMDVFKENNTKIMVVGGGWYGIGGGTFRTYHYPFEEKTLALLKFIDENGYGLGCRDLYSEKVLLNAGLKNVFMTGCPAWYDLPNIHNIKCFRANDSIEKILVSDPGSKKNELLAIELIEFLMQRYKKSKITVVFHRGVDRKSKLCRWLEAHAIEYQNISDGVDGFKIYDDADLHIGFRVHAHLYNLSVRNRSILIEEDGRGTGANEALGLPSIKAYDDTIQLSNPVFNKARTMFGKSSNRNLIQDVNCYLTLLESTDYAYITNAFRIQEATFNSMKRYIYQLNGGNTDE